MVLIITRSGSVDISVMPVYLLKQLGSMRDDLFKNFYHRRDLIDILEDVLLSFEE